MLHLFGFAVFLSQRTEVFSTCNTRAGLPQSQCTRAHHPFCYHVPCLHCSSTLGAWDGAAVSRDGAGERAQLPSTSEFCKAGMLQAAHPLASVPHLHFSHHVLDVAIQPDSTSPAPAEKGPQNTIQN